MAKFKVTLPEDGPLEKRNLTGLGVLRVGQPQKLELSEAQVESLKARGIEVEPLAKPKKESADKKVEREGA